MQTYIYEYSEHRNTVCTSRFQGYFNLYAAFKIKYISIVYKGSANTFFLENALKKTTKYFPKFLFLFESAILPFNNGK